MMSAAHWKKLRAILASIGLVLISLATIAVILMLVWRIPSWFLTLHAMQNPRERFELENELLKTAAQILGGAFLLTGIYFTWQNLALSREGQITDRFNQAVQHLGSEKLEIRLGGIYALARIAQNSQTDHWAAMQVLCARLREATRNRSATDSALPVEAQAILDVLGARSRHFETARQALDLTATNLAGAGFQGCHLERARFNNADLRRANFSRAFISDASFAGADLTEASLRGANCDRVNLVAANLQHATLRDCSLRRAKLFGANLLATALFGADFSGALSATRPQFEAALTDGTTVLPDFSELPPEEPQLDIF